MLVPGKITTFIFLLLLVVVTEKLLGLKPDTELLFININAIDN